MSTKRTISDFLEQMDHEFEQIAVKIDHAGYKVDGDDGIKKHCNLNDFKSVDYFCDRNQQCLLIEFSDLSR